MHCDMHQGVEGIIYHEAVYDKKIGLSYFYVTMIIF